MNALRGFIRKDFRNRIVVFIIPFMVLIIMIISMCCYYIFYKAFKEEKLESTQILIDQIGVQFDAKFKAAKSPVSFLTLNQQIENALKRYPKMSVAEQYFLREELRGNLSNIEIFIDYVTDIIIVGKNGYLFNLPTRYALDEKKYNEEKEWIESFIEPEATRFFYTTSHENDYYNQGEGIRQVVSVLLPLKYQGTYYGYIQADMDYEALNSQLYGIYSQEETDITIVNKDGTIVFDKSEEKLDRKLDQSVHCLLTEKSGSFTIQQDGQKRLVVYQKLDVTEWYLIASISYESIVSASDYVLKIIWLIILPAFTILSVILSMILSSQIRKPIHELSERVESVDIESYEYMERDYGVDVINALAVQFEDSYSKIRELIEKVYVAEIRQKNAQYEVLQKQITPHFMYNSLQLIKTEALIKGNREISEITTSFSNLLRYSLERGIKWVCVQQEKENIEDYLNIYHRRFPGKFSYAIEIDQAIQSRFVLKLILQPIVENCIKHGLRDVSENGRIIVRGYEDKGDIQFEVEDNGEGITQKRIEEIRQSMRDESNMNHVGLINVHRRIQIEDGSGYGLIKIHSQPCEKTIFVIRVRGNRYV